LKVVSINISKKKGTPKDSVEKAKALCKQMTVGVTQMK